MTDIVNNLKLKLALLALLAAGWSNIQAAPGSSNAAAANRVLIVEASSMPLAGGTATLTIGELHRANGVYFGDYKINVSPYFFKNEKGRLAIVVSDESMAEINHGKTATIIGTATTNGKGGITRHVDATATPASINRGTIKLWFMAGERKMTFQPAYHFSENITAALSAQMPETTLASNIKSSSRN